MRCLTIVNVSRILGTYQLARGALISAFIVAFMLPCILYVLEPLFRKTSLHWDKLPEKKKAKRKAPRAQSEETAVSTAAL